MEVLIFFAVIAVIAFTLAKFVGVKKTDTAPRAIAAPLHAEPMRANRRAPARQRIPPDTAIPIVGTGYYDVVDDLDTGPVTVQLVRDPANVYDRNAIYAHVEQERLGAIPKRLAARMAPILDQMGGTVTAYGEFDGVDVFLQPPFPVHSPKTPSLRGYQPWGRLSCTSEVDGENLHRPQIRALYRGAGVAITADGAELDEVPTLVLRSADGSDYLDVVCAGHVVGYLDDATANAYGSAVATLNSQGAALDVTARIWARSSGPLRSRVTLRLPVPDEVFPPMPLPTVPFVVFPALSMFQVTGEERYMDALGPLVATTSPVPAVATLHSTVIQRARSTVEAVQVQILGKVVGELSNVASGHVMPLVKACETAGKVPVVQATVTGNSLKAEVVVRVAKAGEVTQEWLHSHGLASTGVHGGVS